MCRKRDPGHSLAVTWAPRGGPCPPGESKWMREKVCVCVWGGAWRLNEMSEEEGGKDLCVYVRFGGFTDKAENRCMCGRELGVGTRQKRRSSYFLG